MVYKRICRFIILAINIDGHVLARRGGRRRRMPLPIININGLRFMYQSRHLITLLMIVMLIATDFQSLSTDFKNNTDIFIAEKITKDGNYHCKEWLCTI